MRRRVLIACSIAALGFSLSCGQTDEKVAARIGEDVITVAMLKDEYLAISPNARPDLLTIDEKEQFARDVISKELLDMEARNLGFDRMPEAAEAAQNALRSAAWQAFYEDRVRSKVKVSDDDLREMHASQTYSYHIGWIFVRSKALAQDISERIKGGEDFSELASAYSLDITRDKGGDIGMRALGTLPESVEEMVMVMSPGEVSEPIAYDSYYLLVKLFDKQPVEQQDFETARSGLESLVRMRAENQLQRELAKNLREKYGLSFNDDTIDMIVSKTKALHRSEDDPRGQIPEFSDEELGRTVATLEGGEWQVRNYVEGIKGQPDYFRPGLGTDAEAIKSVVRDFITGDIWMLEIHNEGYDQAPEVVKKAERALEEYIVTEMHQHLIRDVKVNEDTLREFYDAQKAELVSEAGARLAVITLATEEEAQQTYQDLQGGASFADLARERSIDTGTGKNGGELMRPLYQRQIEMFPEIDDVVKSVSVGGYSEPMAVPPGFGPEGYMLIKILEKIEPRQLEFEEVREMLSERVLQLEQDKTFGQWLRDKMEELNVEIYPDALSPIKFFELKGRGAEKQEGQTDQGKAR